MRSGPTAFDRDTGDMFIGDVGQDSWEEVDFQPASSAGGENYGWRLMEGNECNNPPNNCNDGSLTLPILEYEHTGFFGDCSITGGFRYRGEDFPLFEGTYFYGDFCTGKIWAGEELGGGNWTSAVLIESGVSITTFGEDEDGELYVADQDGTIYRLVDDRPFCNVRADQDVYTEGDTITLSPASLVNLGNTNLNTRVQVSVVLPSQQTVQLVDLGADGSFVLSANTVLDFAPQVLRTVDANTPTGSFEVVCRMTDPDSGQVFVELSDEFSIE